MCEFARGFLFNQKGFYMAPKVKLFFFVLNFGLNSYLSAKMVSIERLDKKI